MLISVVIPTLNEAPMIEASIQAARAGYGPREVEVVVADGCSFDGTLDMLPTDVRWVRGSRGRAAQMNQGAAEALGDILVFCHADTRLPSGWRDAIIAALAEPGVSGGGFQALYKPQRGWLLWFINHIRVPAVWLILQGDRAQFMTRATYEQIGGFPEIPLMEDVEMARRLHQRGRLKVVTSRVVTSSRRMLERGPTRYLLEVAWNLTRYLLLGATPEEIALSYRSSRERIAEAALMRADHDCRRSDDDDRTATT